jgi:hypothetical protein
MNRIYYIGADVHSNSIELAIQNRRKIVGRYSVPATISAAAEVLDSLHGKKYMAIEEGPMSGWLYRNLHQRVDRFVVADRDVGYVEKELSVRPGQCDFIRTD